MVSQTTHPSPFARSPCHWKLTTYTSAHQEPHREIGPHAWANQRLEPPRVVPWHRQEEHSNAKSGHQVAGKSSATVMESSIYHYNNQYSIISLNGGKWTQMGSQHQTDCLTGEALDLRLQGAHFWTEFGKWPSNSAVNALKFHALDRIDIKTAAQHVTICEWIVNIIDGTEFHQICF